MVSDYAVPPYLKCYAPECIFYRCINVLKIAPIIRIYSIVTSQIFQTVPKPHYLDKYYYGLYLFFEIHLTITCITNSIRQMHRGMILEDLSCLKEGSAE